MVRLSVNINKIALIRNSRGANMPNVLKMAQDIEEFGGQGITVHPRPDERHIRFDDLIPLKEVVSTEFNIEGYPSRHFVEEVCRVIPHQVTLVPDAPDALTSNAGWNTIQKSEQLKEVVDEFKAKGIRTSLFVDPLGEMLEGAAKIGADRIEFYTGPYAHHFHHSREKAVAPFKNAAKIAHELGLGINAGHDLNLDNLAYFKQEVNHLMEVSIGHALVCDALYFGLKNTIQMYLRELA